MAKWPGRPEQDGSLLRGGAIAVAVAAGSRSAFEQLHARLSPAIRATLLRRCGGRQHVAEDLLQQTWTLVWQSVSQRRYDPHRAAISTFVYAVANNVWLQYARGNMREELRPMPMSAGADLERALELAELLDELRAYLREPEARGGLSDLDREIVVESARGVTERELAGRLGLAPSTVNSRKQATYAKIREALERRGFTRELVEQMPLNLE